MPGSRVRSARFSRAQEAAPRLVLTQLPPGASRPSDRDKCHQGGGLAFTAEADSDPRERAAPAARQFSALHQLITIFRLLRRGRVQILINSRYGDRVSALCVCVGIKLWVLSCPHSRPATSFDMLLVST